MNSIKLFPPRRPFGNVLRVGLIVSLAVLAWVPLQRIASNSAPGAEQAKKQEYGPWISSVGEIDRLIQQLGSPRMPDRDAAAEALLAIGEPALDAVSKAASESRDPEVLQRTQGLKKSIIKQMQELGAWVTSAHSVYSMNEPIDLTLWVRKTANPITPALEVRDDNGQLVREKTVDGKNFLTSKNRSGKPGPADHRIPPAQFTGPGTILEPYVELVSDLRAWFEINKPGRYVVRFVGREALGNGKTQQVMSNAMTVWVREKAEATDRVIPLKDIWAYRMPGTRNMDASFVLVGGDEKKREYVAPEGRLLNEIGRVLVSGPQKPALARPGFPVRGQGMDALREAHAVLNGRKPTNSLKPGVEVSLVFFTYWSAQDIHLVRVEQRTNIVQITYRRPPPVLMGNVAQFPEGETEHIALIPIGKLPKGAYQVYVKEDIDSKGINPLNLGRVNPLTICRSFGFDIIE